MQLITRSNVDTHRYEGGIILMHDRNSSECSKKQQQGCHYGEVTPAAITFIVIILPELNLNVHATQLPIAPRAGIPLGRRTVQR